MSNYLITVVMPKKIYSSIPFAPHVGLLHAYVRHYPELEQHIAGLSAIRVSPPATMQKALNGITAVFNMAAAATDIAVFQNEYSSCRSARMILYKTQLMVHAYLQSVMSSGSQPIIATNAFGKYKIRYSVNRNATLVVSPTDDVKAAVKRFGDDRPPFGYCFTAFLVKVC
uniref:WS_DGAT_C domain-containing protein n=1 Tax=Panagrellus redivivus TaxID=6233 RepID=A0A7E4W6B5_PANRE